MKKRVFLYIALAIALTLQTDKAPTSLNASNLASVEAGRSGLGSDLAPEATAAGLRDAFRDPPAEFRPLPMIHSHALQDPAVSQWLSDRHAGGAVIDAGVKPGTHDIDGEAGNNPTWLNDPAQFERLRKTIEEQHELNAAELADQVFREVEWFAQGAPLADDRTLVVLKVR